MGESKRKRVLHDRLVTHAKAGRLLGMPGSHLENADPLQLAAATAKESNIEFMLGELDRGVTIYASGRRAGLDDLRKWKPSEKLGPLVLQALQLCTMGGPEICGVIPIPFGGEDILADDREWLEANPGRYLRIRSPIGAENRVGVPEDGFVARTIMVVLSHELGARSRFAISCPVGSPEMSDDLDDMEVASVALEYGNFHGQHKELTRQFDGLH